MPLKSIQKGRIEFAEADGRRFSIEATPDGGIHNVSTRIVDGEPVVQEWFWLLLLPTAELG